MLENLLDEINLISLVFFCLVLINVTQTNGHEVCRILPIHKDVVLDFMLTFANACIGYKVELL